MEVTWGTWAAIAVALKHQIIMTTAAAVGFDLLNFHVEIERMEEENAIWKVVDIHCIVSAQQ